MQDLSLLVPELDHMDQLMSKLEFVFQLSPDLEHEEWSDRQRNSAEDEFWVWDQLNDFMDVWKSLDLMLCNVESEINIGTFIDMGHEEHLLEFKQVRQRPFLKRVFLLWMHAGCVKCASNRELC